MWYVYILKCKNGVLYTDISEDVQRRFEEHVSGKGGHFTRSFIGGEIVFYEDYPDNLRR